MQAVQLINSMLSEPSLRSQCIEKDQFPLESTSRLQQSRELSLLSLKLGVAANMLLVDKDVGDSALVGDFLKSSLDVGAVI